MCIRTKYLAQESCGLLHVVWSLSWLPSEPLVQMRLWSLDGYASKIAVRVGQGQAVSGSNLLSCSMGPLTGRGTHRDAKEDALIIVLQDTLGVHKPLQNE